MTYVSTCVVLKHNVTWVKSR